MKPIRITPHAKERIAARKLNKEDSLVSLEILNASKKVDSLNTRGYVSEEEKALKVADH